MLGWILKLTIGVKKTCLYSITLEFKKSTTKNINVQFKFIRKIMRLNEIVGDSIVKQLKRFLRCESAFFSENM